MSPRSNWFMNVNMRRRWNRNEPYRRFTRRFKSETLTQYLILFFCKPTKSNIHILASSFRTIKRRKQSHFPSDSHSMAGRNKSMVNKAFPSVSEECCRPKYLPSYRCDVVYKTHRKTPVSLVQTANFPSIFQRNIFPLSCQNQEATAEGRCPCHHQIHWNHYLRADI